MPPINSYLMVTLCCFLIVHGQSFGQDTVENSFIIYPDSAVSSLVLGVSTTADIKKALGRNGYVKSRAIHIPFLYRNHIWEMSYPNKGISIRMKRGKIYSIFVSFINGVEVSTSSGTMLGRTTLKQVYDAHNDIINLEDVRTYDYGKNGLIFYFTNDKENYGQNKLKAIEVSLTENVTF